MIGHVFNLEVKTSLGPWSNGQHPGVVVGVPRGANVEGLVVVPMSSAKPRGGEGSWCVTLHEVRGSLQPVLYVYCHLPMTVPRRRLQNTQHRGVLSKGELAVIRTRLGRLFGIPPTSG